MSKLSINPQSQLVQKVNAGISEAIAAAEQAQPKIGNALAKAKLDLKSAQLSGDLGSGLNQASSLASTFNDQIQTGMGNFTKVVDSPVGSSNLGSLSENVGSFGKLGDTIGGAITGAGNEIGGLLSKVAGGDLAGGLQNLASGISKGAGALNDLLSLRRAENLPKNGELFQQSGEGLQVIPQLNDDWRVRISCDWSQFKDNPLFAPLDDDGTKGVVFPILPSITYSTKANYTQIDPVHNNYPFQAYKNSQVDEINIQGTFIAENELQAAYWISAVTFFKTMTKMFFGQGANAGAPPPVCQLNGYGASVFDNVPVVVKSFSLDLPNDVNYIRCNAYGTKTWVPITSSITINVQPVYNRRNLRSFSLTEYAKGTLRTPSGRGYL
jgi:hypothetical protein